MVYDNSIPIHPHPHPTPPPLQPPPPRPHPGHAAARRSPPAPWPSGKGGKFPAGPGGVKTSGKPLGFSSFDMFSNVFEDDSAGCPAKKR